MADDYIPGAPEDYYLELKDQDGTIRYSGVRTKIRFIAELQNQVIKNAISSEGNAYTASLDFSDKLSEFMRTSPGEAQVAFYEVYNQELQAIASKTNDDTDKLLVQAAETEASTHAAGQWVAAAVILIFVMIVISNM